MLVTIIMAVHNEPVGYLRESISSILNQTYQNFEFIIVDDASADLDTVEFLNGLVDSRIEIIRNQHNLGLTASLNKALDMSSGDFIARMDADDISRLDRISMQVNFLNRNSSVTLCGSNVRLLNSTRSIRPFISRLLNRNIIKYPGSDNLIRSCLFVQNPICHPSVMWRCTALTKYLRYNDSYKKAQDYSFWVENSEFFTFANIQDTLLTYRVSSRQISSRSKKEQDWYADGIRIEMLRKYSCLAKRDQRRFELLFQGRKYRSNTELMLEYAAYVERYVLSLPADLFSIKDVRYNLLNG